MAQRPPFWTVDSVDPSPSGVTQQTMLQYSAGRVVGDCCSTMFKLSLTIKKKKKERGKSVTACSPFCMKNEQDMYLSNLIPGPTPPYIPQYGREVLGMRWQNIIHTSSSINLSDSLTFFLLHAGADESVSLNISILILLTGVAFCLIAGLSIALKCTVSRLRKQNNVDNEDCSSTERRNYGPHRIPRVTLNSSAWTDRQLDLFTSLAPPSYEDTVLTDQNVQAQPQQQDILPPQPPTTTEGTTNERPAGNEDSSHRDSEW